MVDVGQTPSLQQDHLRPKPEGLQLLARCQPLDAGHLGRSSLPGGEEAADTSERSSRPLLWSCWVAKLWVGGRFPPGPAHTFRPKPANGMHGEDIQIHLQILR